MKLCLVCNFQFEDEQEFCPKDSSRLIVLSKDPLIGKAIQDRYKIDSLIAKGSMGTIYKASQELLGREVAIKVLHDELVSDEVSLKRFQAEAKAASRLNHPSITTLYDFGVLPSGQPYMVMELLHGKNLANLIKQKRQLSLSEILVVFDHICQALSEAHKCGVVHRDIKPENIVLDESPERNASIKIVDFGIAKFFQEREDTLSKITKTGTICGSPTYMSPEQCDDQKIDHRSDIYSLGIVLYEALTGKVPFGSKDVYTVMSMHIKENPPRLTVARPDLNFPPFLESVIEKALAKKPDDRYQTIEDFWNAVKSACGEKESISNAFPSSDQIAELITRKPGGNVAEMSNIDVHEILTRTLNRQQEVKDKAKTEKDNKRKKRRKEKKEKRADETTLVLNPAEHKARQRRGSVSFSVRLFSLGQQLLPGILTVVLFASLLYLLVKEPTIRKAIESGKANFSRKTNLSAESLIAMDKLDEARSLLEEKERNKALSNSEQRMLNSVYLRLAKKEASAKRYTSALNLLEQISGRKSNEVQSLLNKYNALADK